MLHPTYGKKDELEVVSQQLGMTGRGGGTLREGEKKSQTGRNGDVGARLRRGGGTKVGAKEWGVGGGEGRKGSVCHDNDHM